MDDSEAQQPAQQPPVNSAQQVVLKRPADYAKQVTSTVPATKQKNPKRVAAGKAIAERTKQAREAQKKKLAEADIIIANNQLKKAEAAAAADPPAAQPPAADPPAADPPTRNVLTTAQWLSVISIFISMVGIYYKREEIKNVLTKKPPKTPPVDVATPEPQRKGGIRPMD